MKKSKHLVALPILLMSCALSLTACFGGGELDNGSGPVIENNNNTEGMSEVELAEQARQDILTSLTTAIDEKRYDDAINTATQVMQNAPYDTDEEISMLRDRASGLKAAGEASDMTARERTALVAGLNERIANGQFNDAVVLANAALEDAFAGDEEIIGLRDTAATMAANAEAEMVKTAAHRDLIASLNLALEEMRYDDAIAAANIALAGDYADDDAVIALRNQAQTLKSEANEEQLRAAEEARAAREAARTDLLARLNGMLGAGNYDGVITVAAEALASPTYENDAAIASIHAEAVGRKRAAAEAEKLEAASKERDFYLTRANREIDGGKMADALKTLDYGLERFPGDEALTKLLNQVKASIANRSGGTSNDLERDLINTIEEYRREADKIFEEARGKFDDGDFSGSKAAYLRLLELIQVSPYKAELQDTYEAKANAGFKAADFADERVRTQDDEKRSIAEARLYELRAKADQKRRGDQIVELWRQVLFNMEVKRFNDAEDLVRTILDIDPNFKIARDLQDQIQELRLQNIRRDTYEQKMQGWRNALLQVREAMQPDTAIVRYPQGALVRRIVERRNYLPDFSALDAGEVRLRNALEATVMSLESDPDDDATKKTLRDAISLIAAKANVHILFSKNSDTETLADGDIEVNLQNLSARRILSILKDTYTFEEVFSEGVLFIRAAGSDDEADLQRRQREVVTLVHDIRDITYQLQDFAGPVLNLRGQDESVSFEPPEPPEPIDSDTMIEFIQGGVRGDADFWQAPNVISSFGGQLIVTAAPQVQAEVKEFLRKMRRTAGLLVAMEARFIEVEDNYLTDFGIDFRGLGGPSNVPNQANLVLEDVTGQPEDAAGGAFDNGALGVPALNPSAGIFFNDDDPSGRVNFNRDIRGRFENIFDNALGNQLSNVGGMAMQVAIFHNLTQINMVIRAVQKKGRAQTLVAPRLSAYNTQRANIAIISQIPYIEDFQVQTAAAAGIANPIMDTILDGIVMEVVPTVSNDRRFITMEVQPTVAELNFPIPTFVTTLGPTSAVTIQIPELHLQAAKTTVRIPDGGAIVIGGLKRARDIDRESGTPILSDLPLIGVLFRRKGRSIEQSNLVIVIKANIIDLSDEELRQPGYN